VRIGLLSLPTSRKKHGNQIPLVGGIAMLFGISIGLLALNISLRPYRILLLVIIGMVFFSFLDDLHELSHKTKFFVQFVIALIMVHFGHLVINNLGNFLFFGNIGLGAISLPFTVIAIMAVINAINMMDGMDGLLGSIALCQFLLLIFLSWYIGYFHDCYLMIIISSALLAFLVFNFPYKKKRKSRIFMGDIGSTLIGILLVWFLINLSKNSASVINHVVFLWIMAIPLFDVINVVFRRICNQKHIFHADRQHLHHILHKSGLNYLSSVLIIVILSLLFGVAGIVMNFLHVSESVMFMILLVCFGGYMFMVNYRSRRQNKINLITQEMSGE